MCLKTLFIALMATLKNQPLRPVCMYVCGGLGNQMFQYACGRALSSRHNAPLFLDLTWFGNSQEDTRRRFHLNAFPALNPRGDLWKEASKKDLQTYYALPLWKRLLKKVLPRNIRRNPKRLEEPHVGYWDGIEHLTPPVHLCGYWQDVRYFLPQEDLIRADFTFPPLPEAAQPLAQKITSSSNAVAVHVRRGDYVTNPEINAAHGLCPASYYAAALTQIRNQVSAPHIFAFSDDPEWVKENFDSQNLPITVVDLHTEHDAHHDMHLMTLCRHHIIANSSFSWWGTWLKAEEGITCAPQRWFAFKPEFRGLLLPHWLSL